MFENTRIPVWVNLFLVVTILFMAVQVVWFYFNHEMLLDAGITIQGTPDLNIIYTTAGRLVAMIAVAVFALVTQNPHHFLIVLFMSILREGQEMFIDPLFPYGNAGPPLLDFVMHVVIVALEIWAFMVVYKITKREKKQLLRSAKQQQTNDRMSP